MDLNQQIRAYSSQPLTHQLLLSLLKDYKRPNDKINSLVSGKILESVKKGLYVAGPVLHTGRPPAFLLANHIAGPSYVSLESALSFYGIIPERVFECTSMTTKTSRAFNSAMGKFSYTHLSLPYYSFGITNQKLQDNAYALVASPEKAVADKLVVTPGIAFRSKKAATAWMLDDMRMNETALKKFDIAAMNSWMHNAPKKESLQFIIKAIVEL